MLQPTNIEKLDSSREGVYQHPLGKLLKQINVFHQKLGYHSVKISDLKRSGSELSRLPEKVEVCVLSARLIDDVWRIFETSRDLALKQAEKILNMQQIGEAIKVKPSPALLAYYFSTVATSAIRESHTKWLEDSKKALADKEHTKQGFLRLNQLIHGPSFDPSNRYVKPPLLGGFCTGARTYFLLIGAMPEAFHQQFGYFPNRAEMKQLMKAAVRLAKILSKMHVRFFLELQDCISDTGELSSTKFIPEKFKLIRDEKGFHITIKESVLNQAFLSTRRFELRSPDSFDLAGRKLVTTCPANYSPILSKFFKWLVSFSEETFLSRLSQTSYLSESEIKTT
ncbi:MAG: hypothetical protein KDD56_06310 [Bdellovibrionales bacterium]|nr:hypothetical protein [Bdellovibrionales bacterium]